MAGPTAAPHHHDCPSSSTASCSASTSYVHYDIFITPCSLDWPDVCTFATALESKLVSRQLQVFFHKLNYMLEEEFTSEMEGVISVASVHIVIFSPYYAQWKWCLDSLVQIKKSGGTILPVFYKVKPCEVRWTGQDNHGLYAQWLRDHEEKERYDSETIQNWRDVLSQVSKISGFELEACNGGEEELLRKVVKSVFEDFPHLRYQVFLNHRGPDTKTTLASELYRRLTSGGLRVFLDQPELAEGVQISPQIEVAIQFASVHIAIFSPKYAESSWCLDELYLMIKSGAIIFPVFYKVKRWVLDGEYAEELLKHENSPRYKSADIQRWRSALSEVAKIKCFFEMNGNEQDVLNDIVQKVSDNVPKDSQVVQSAEERRMVKSVLTEDVSNNVILIDREWFHRSQLNGCPWGLEWNDGTYSGIRRITMTEKDNSLTSLQMHYGLEGDQSVKDIFFFGLRHGVADGASVQYNLKYPEEIVTKISGYFGSYKSCDVIKSLTFYTNLRKLGPCGREQGTHFETEERGKIVGMFGSSGSLLDSIGVYHTLKPRISTDHVFCRSQPYGGFGGEYWSDGVYSGIRKITMTTSPNNWLASVQLQYGLEGDESVKDKYFPGVRHGSPSGTRTDYNLNYPKEEIVTKISGHFGKYGPHKVLISLTFHTNQRKLGPCGAEVGPYFESDVGGKIVGVFGSSGDLIDSIGVYAMKPRT